MVFHIDPTMSPRLAPLAWMLGRWEGAGVVGYPDRESGQFGQELIASHDGQDYITWTSRTWMLDDEGRPGDSLAVESGFWRPEGEEGEFALLLAHPTGYVEQYFGARHPDRPSIELATDGILRTADAEEYAAAKRLYGLVNGDLMWVMDMAYKGHPMTSHMSAQLKRVEG